MIRKGNECHTINNAIFLNKSQADKSRKSHNERFTLSTANFRTGNRNFESKERFSTANCEVLWQFLREGKPTVFVVVGHLNIDAYVYYV